jgi:hypothetical protein
MSRQPHSQFTSHIPKSAASASKSCLGTLPSKGDINECAIYISRPRPSFYNSSPRCDRAIPRLSVSAPRHATSIRFQAQNTNYSKQLLSSYNHCTSTSSPRVQYQRIASQQSSSSIQQPKTPPTSSNLISPRTTYSHSNLEQQNN